MVLPLDIGLKTGYVTGSGVTLALKRRERTPETEVTMDATAGHRRGKQSPGMIF
jgi:hypothetical protein